MFNQEFLAELKSVSSMVFKVKRDGLECKESRYRIIIESNDIGYEEIEHHLPYLHKLITSDQDGMFFKTIVMGEVGISGLSMRFTGTNENGEYDTGIIIDHVRIKNLTVVNNMNIPHYILSLEIPKETSGRYLLQNLKSHVKITLNKPAELFDNIANLKAEIRGKM